MRYLPFSIHVSLKSQTFGSETLVATLAMRPEEILQKVSDGKNYMEDSSKSLLSSLAPSCGYRYKCDQLQQRTFVE